MADVPLPEPELFYWKPSFIKGESVHIFGYTADQMHAHAAAVSAADNAALQGELESLQESFGQQLAKVNKLTERVRVLEDALRRGVEFTEFLWRDVPLNDYAEEKRDAVENLFRAALEKP